MTTTSSIEQDRDHPAENIPDMRVAVIVLSLLLASVPAAQAAPAALTVAVGFRYAPGAHNDPAPLMVSQGGRLFFANADPMGAHSLVSFDTDAHDDPLFRSTPINMGEQTEVAGVASLPPGAYDFFCDVHGPVMAGALYVTPA